VRILAGDDLTVQIEFHDWNGLAGEQVMLVLSSEATLTEGGEVTLDYLTWDGLRGSLATFTFDHNGAIQGETRTGDRNIVLVTYLPSQYSAQETYILDFATREVQGFKEGCGITSGLAAGQQFAAFACSENRLVWRYLSLHDPLNQQMIEVQADLDPPIRFEPIWLDAHQLLLRQDFSKAACVADVVTGNLACHKLDFWLGPMSPDGRRFEVRIGLDIAPDQIGVVGSDCLLHADAPCNPRLRILPPDVAPLDSAIRSLKDSVWLPDSRGLLYIVHLNNDRTTTAYERSEIWRYDITSQSFEMLFDLPGEFDFGEPRFELAPPPWSPDGSSVVVKDGGSFLLLNVETGDLTPLTEGGVLLGTITLP
jgi:hypothetical protein